MVVISANNHDANHFTYRLPFSALAIAAHPESSKSRGDNITAVFTNDTKAKMLPYPGPPHT